MTKRIGLAAGALAALLLAASHVIAARPPAVDIKDFKYGPPELTVRVGERVIALQRDLADRIRTLEEALGQVKQLEGFLPICAYCKKIRNDESYWEQIEVYIGERSRTTFSHGICPDCDDRIVQPQLDEWRKSKVAS